MDAHYSHTNIHQVLPEVLRTPLFLQRHPSVKHIQTTAPSAQHLQACLQVNAVCFTPSANAYLDGAILGLQGTADLHMQLLMQDDAPIGYAITTFQHQHAKLKDTPFFDSYSCFFAMAAIHPAFQGTGAYRFLNTIRLQQMIERKIDYLFIRTQNPKGFLMMSNLLHDAVSAGQLINARLVWAETQQTPFDGVVSVCPESIPPERVPPEIRQVQVQRGDVGIFVWQIRQG